MRLDHIAYRVKDREETARLLSEMFGYRNVSTFEPLPGVKCIAMAPIERHVLHRSPMAAHIGVNLLQPNVSYTEFHLAPEIFVSEGTPSSIVGKWVAARGHGGIHHLAYQVANVQTTMDIYRGMGIQFESDKPWSCPGIEQVFTKPILSYGGIVIELISRTPEVGFCQDNVKALMESTDAG